MLLDNDSTATNDERDDQSFDLIQSDQSLITFHLSSAGCFIPFRQFRDAERTLSGAYLVVELVVEAYARKGSVQAIARIKDSAPS